jgi:hypothetical protein
MRVLLLACVVAVLVVGGLWASASAPAPRARDPQATPTAAPVRPSPTPERPRRARRVVASACPTGLAGCRSVRGRVVYVESVDPDGDGDLHVVLAAGSITGPGLTAVDVAPELRPKRDPRPGDQVSAAGPVQRGSYGQSQIHAVELHVRRG